MASPPLVIEAWIRVNMAVETTCIQHVAVPMPVGGLVRVQHRQRAQERHQGGDEAPQAPGASL